MENIIDTIKGLSHQYRDEVIAWRRHLHQHPELSQQEFGTMAFVAERLREMGLEPRTGIGKTGVMAMIRGGKNPDGYCVGLRSDYDALPLTEVTGLPFAHSRMLSAVISMILCLASFVAQEMCGVIMQFLAFKSGLSAFIGSVDTTSTAAAYTLPLSRASARSYSLTSGPRLLLIRITPSFILLMFSLLMIPSVSGKSGQ